ncbi:MAG TPA: ribonuclease D [Chloroflexi bacterium]|nr:ribonuclease D [Chloroflexota bacterium]
MYPPSFTLVRSQEQLTTLLERLLSRPTVAVDTESNSLYAYHERVCLIQFSTEEADFIVDPLAGIDLSPLGDLFANPTIQKVFHAAEQDVANLKRDFGFRFANLFDTMWAARILGWPRVGLADVLEETFGVHTDKRYQRYNWGKRPLPPEALRYASRDTHYLLPLRDLQAEALERSGRMEEAGEVFAQLAETGPASNPFGPSAFWRLKGLDDLPPRERAVLYELFLWRDREAARRDVPPFRVMGERTMRILAHLRPHTLDDLSRVRALRPKTLHRYGEAILEAIARGERRPPPEPPPSPPPPAEPVLQRYHALRAWRREVAARRGVENDVVLPNAVLWALAERNPTSLGELADVPGLGPWKRKTYGPAILEVLATSDR